MCRIKNSIYSLIPLYGKKNSHIYKIMHKKKIRTVYTIYGYLFSGLDMVTIFPLYSTCPAHSICFIYSVIGLKEFPSKSLSCRQIPSCSYCYDHQSRCYLLLYTGM